MEVDYKAIGQRIKIARIKKGVTQETVADLIDITPAHMSNVETGKTKVSLPTLIAIANALSVSVDTLLCDNVIASKIVFEKEAKDIFSDCDEYEVRFLVSCVRSCVMNRIFQTISRVSPESAINLNNYNNEPTRCRFPLVGLLFAAYILKAEYVENCEYKE